MNLYKGCIAAVFALSVPGLQAQDRVMGAQLQLALPADSLRETTGGKPGLGLGLHLEQPMGDSWSWRVGLAGQMFPEGTSTGQPSRKGKASLVKAGFDAVWFPGPDLGPVRTGPYVSFGIAFVSWDVRTVDAELLESRDRKVVHAAGQAGFGYRLSPGMDVELGLLYGRVDPTLSAGVLTLGFTTRF